jgi:hypothetical protein
MADETAQISLNDLQVAVNIIDACTKRGAFEGNELLAVGQLREKFANFVKANTAAAEPAAETTKEAAE